MKRNIESIERETFEKDDSPEIPPPDIVAYNELRSCADLHRMVTQNILEIQPEFQRQIVWKVPDQTRFIDSLIKQLPIPSMCFALDYKKQRWQVIDGLQRIYTINRFLSDPTWKLSSLEDIDANLAGKKVSDLMDENSEFHHFYTRVENLTLPITVLRCEFSKRSHYRYLFTIFHRLNTGGMKLNNQEIRNCIFSGSFNRLLKKLDNNEKWRKINKMKGRESYRFTKQELILRFFAFHDNFKNYNGRLARFLNDYMGVRRDIKEDEINVKIKLFTRTLDIVYRKVFEGKIPSKISITLLEALLVGVSFNISYLESQSPKQVKALYKNLQKHDEFSEQKLSEGLSGKPRVIGRINAAKTIFSGK
jgi:hypothetical protein